MYPGGFYSADVSYKGITQRKTFFPANLSPEEILRMTVEFTEKFNHLAVQNHGAWKIEQELIEGVKLRVIISKHMSNITDYPILL